MIVKIHLVLALVVYTSIKGVSSASFSKVFVHNQAEYPVEYLYGAPSVSYSPQIAQLTAAPVDSVVPYSPNYLPCGTPCVYPTQVASIAPSGNIVQYQPPNLPVVVASSKSKPSGYEYGYVVYDEQTGDYKVQRELSDGSMVRGGYSFLQPDGFVREVQYIADDLQGFNAVVKNYLPTNVETKKHDDAEKTDLKPGHETKDDNSKADKTEHQNSAVENGQEEHHAEPSHANLEAQAHEGHHHEHHIHKHVEGDEHSHPEHHEAHKEHHEDKVEPLEEHHKSNAVPQKAEEEQAQVEAHEGPIPKQHEHETYEALVSKVYESAVEAVIEKLAEEPTESSESTEKLQLVVIEPEVKKIHDYHIAVAGHDIENTMNLAPYNDIVRCVQAAINEGNEVSSAHKAESPLTYIILNKPC